jgi:hypothetical protein
MNLTAEQQHAIKKGEAVEMTVDGWPCVLLSREVYDRVKRAVEYDDSEWTEEEMSLLASESADMLGWEGMEIYQDTNDES